MLPSWFRFPDFLSTRRSNAAHEANSAGTSKTARTCNPRRASSVTSSPNAARSFSPNASRSSSPTSRTALQVFVRGGNNDSSTRYSWQAFEDKYNVKFPGSLKECVRLDVVLKEQVRLYTVERAVPNFTVQLSREYRESVSIQNALSTLEKLVESAEGTRTYVVGMMDP